jgi:nitroreductase
MDFNKVIEERSSIKKYSSKKPKIESIIEAIETSNKAPAAGNLQPTSFIIVENQETINKVADACQQDFISNAPYVIIVCSNINQLKKMYDKRSEKYIKHYVGAAVENFLLKITDMGLASCWVGPFSEETLRNHFSIPENNEIELIITVGYEFIKGKSKPKRKHSLVNRVFFEDWGNKFHKPLEKVRRKDI